jgi:hypothetical protein
MGLVMADCAARGGAELAMASHVAGDAADDGALDASLGLRRRDRGKCQQANGGENRLHGRSPRSRWSDGSSRLEEGQFRPAAILQRDANVIREFGEVPQDLAVRFDGYAPDRDYRYIEINRHVRQFFPKLLAEIVVCLENAGGFVVCDPVTELLLINRELPEWNASYPVCRKPFLRSKTHTVRIISISPS